MIWPVRFQSIVQWNAAGRICLFDSVIASVRPATTSFDGNPLPLSELIEPSHHKREMLQPSFLV